MDCSFCGSKLLESSRYCYACGRSLHDTKAKPEDPGPAGSAAAPLLPVLDSTPDLRRRRLHEREPPSFSRFCCSRPLLCC
jgi:hypothetical protein